MEMLHSRPTTLMIFAALVTGCSANQRNDGVIDAAAIGFISPLTEAQLQLAVLSTVGLAAKTDLRTPWEAMRNTIDAGDGGCPGVQGGRPSGATLPGAGGLPNGSSWEGGCEAGTLEYIGYAYWEDEIDGENAARAIWADAFVTTPSAVQLELDGQGRDSLSWSGDTWTYQSVLTGTFSGARIASDDGPFPGGFRTDMFLNYQGGGNEHLEITGQTLYYEALYQDNFDSFDVDIELQGSAGASPDDCLVEPAGLVSFRDAEARWYDVVFEPKYLSNIDYENAPYSGCDSCGTVYFRGFEQPSQVCVNFEALWQGLLTPPDPELFSL